MAIEYCNNSCAYDLVLLVQNIVLLLDLITFTYVLDLGSKHVLTIVASKHFYFQKIGLKSRGT